MVYAQCVLVIVDLIDKHHEDNEPWVLAEPITKCPAYCAGNYGPDGLYDNFIVDVPRWRSDASQIMIEIKFDVGRNASILQSDVADAVHMLTDLEDPYNMLGFLVTQQTGHQIISVRTNHILGSSG